MTIASEITRINGNIAAAYTAANNKGATIPATQNSANLATCIGTISGGGSSTKYGIDIDMLIGDTNASNVLLQPTGDFNLVIPDVEDIGKLALYYKFYNNLGIKTVSFPDLEKISKDNACTQTFVSCRNLTSVSFPALTDIGSSSTSNKCCLGMFTLCDKLTAVNLSELTTLTGLNVCEQMFQQCSLLTSIDLSSLTTISAYNGCKQMFNGCSSLTTVDLSYLSVINQSKIFEEAFMSCSSLTSLSFPALTSQSFGIYTNQFNGMLRNCTGVTVHFPSNLQSVIGSWGDVTAGFGGTSTTILFDLTATS